MIFVTVRPPYLSWDYPFVSLQAEKLEVSSSEVKLNRTGLSQNPKRWKDFILGLRQMKNEHFGEHAVCQAQLLFSPHPLVNLHHRPEWLFSLSREGVWAQRSVPCKGVLVPMSEMCSPRLGRLCLGGAHSWCPLPLSCLTDTWLIWTPWSLALEISISRTCLETVHRSSMALASPGKRDSESPWWGQTLSQLSPCLTSN